MTKVKDKLVERRKYIRLEIPVRMTYTTVVGGKIFNAVTKNISADGLRFETQDHDLAAGSEIEFKLVIPDASSPVHAKGTVIWKKHLSLEDSAPYDVGIEFSEVEDDNKNTFLKFLCDVIYTLAKETPNAKTA